MTSLQKTCNCGYTTEHEWVTEKGRYSFIGWIYVVIGISVLPKDVVLFCGQCGFVFECFIDTKKLEEYRFK